MAYKLAFIHYFAISTTPWDRHYYLYLGNKEAKVRVVENHIQVAQLLDAGVWILAWLSKHQVLTMILTPSGDVLATK